MSLNTILYDEETAGKYIGGASSPISTRTLQRWRLEGVGPTFVKLGRPVRYRSLKKLENNGSIIVVSKSSRRPNIYLKG